MEEVWWTLSRLKHRKVECPVAVEQIVEEVWWTLSRLKHFFIRLFDCICHSGRGVVDSVEIETFS